MTLGQYPIKQDILLLLGTFETADKMLNAATNLLFELKQVKDRPEKVNQLPIKYFELFIQLLPVLNSHCTEWRLNNLTKSQLKKVQEIEKKVKKMEKICADSRLIMNYLLVQTPLHKIY